MKNLSNKNSRNKFLKKLCTGEVLSSVNFLNKSILVKSDMYNF